MARKSQDEAEQIVHEDPEEEWENAERDQERDEEDADDDPHVRRIGQVHLNPDDRGGHSPADIAARLSSPGTLTEQDIRWSAGANDPTWVAPRQPVQQIIKVLAKLEHVGGYRRPRDVFGDWLNLVEATLHMLPQQLLYLRMHQTLMPPNEEPPGIQEVFKQVMRPYGDRWNEAQKLFQEAYHILTEAAHGMVFDALGAIYMALEIGNARAGQYFSPWAIASMMPQMIMADIESEIFDYIGEAIDSWLGSEAYKLMGMQWGRAHPATTRWIWEKHLDPLYFMTRRFKVLEPCSGSGIFVLGAISVTPPWIVNQQLVEFFCVDIDPICAQMTRINLCLYGANGYALLCQLPIVAPEDQLPTFEQLEHRYLQIASHVQCANALSHDWVRRDDGVWEMVYWADTPAGKARAAEREREASEAQARAAIEKEQLKAAQKVKTAKEKASARGQELLFDIELPSTDARAALTADRQREQGHGNGHTTGETTPGAAGDWTAFVERARAAAGTPEAKTGTASAQRAIEELAADLTQGTLF
jgi:hypothetical protein